MPNWCEGKLKIRGKKEDILKFFKDGTSLIDYDKNHETIEIIPNVEMNDELYIENLNKTKTSLKSLYIKGTRRHFLKPDFEYIDTYNIEEKEPIVAIDFKAAWAIDAESLSEISKKYNIDFKIYAFEMGCEFNQDIEIIKGRIIRNEEITFENYVWECIDPTLGG